jgi:hypothetical protein
MGWARDLGRTGRRRRVVRERPGGRRPLVGAGLAAASTLRRGVDRCRYRLLVAAVESGRGTYLLLGTRRHAAGGSYPGSVFRLPPLEFFMFVVGHLGIVVAALFLVVGLRLRPRPGSVTRVFAITAAYTAFVGWFDWGHRLQLHVPGGGPQERLATVGARPLAVVHPQCGRCRPRPAADPGCAVLPPQASRTELGRESATGPAPARTAARRKRWTLTARTGRTTTSDGRGPGRVRGMPSVDHR